MSFDTASEAVQATAKALLQENQLIDQKLKVDLQLVLQNIEQYGESELSELLMALRHWREQRDEEWLPRVLRALLQKI